MAVGYPGAKYALLSSEYGGGECRSVPTWIRQWRHARVEESVELLFASYFTQFYLTYLTLPPQLQDFS
jgi:hypothetical protein